MKIAVIIIGRLEYGTQKETNLSLLKGCDVFIHSDKKYKLQAAELKPVNVILTENNQYDCLVKTYKKVYKSEILKLRPENRKALKHSAIIKTENGEKKKVFYDIHHFTDNFERIPQWVRLEESLHNFDLKDYDVVFKWRTDYSKVNGKHNRYIVNFIKNYKNLKYFLESNFDSDYIYMYKDLFFGGSYKKMLKSSFYHRIKDFICTSNEDHEFSQNILSKCDLSAGRFEWLQEEYIPFKSLFISETAFILNCLQNNIPIKSFLK